MLVKKIHRAMRGGAMLELIAATAVMGVIGAYALTNQIQATDQSTGRLKSENISSFQQLAAQYFTANRADIEAAMGGDTTAAGVHCLLNVAANGSGGTVATNATKHTCAFDSTFLRGKGLWPSGSPTEVPEGRYVAIVRQVLSSGTPTGADEMLVALAPISGGNVMTSGTVAYSGDLKRASDELQAGMNSLGGQGGYIPPGKDMGSCQYNGTTKQVCGNGWAVNLNDFIN